MQVRKFVVIVDIKIKNRGMHGDSLLMLTTKVVSNKKPPLLSDSESGGSTSQIQKRKNSIDHILKGVKQLVDVGIPLDEKTEGGL